MIQILRSAEHPRAELLARQTPQSVVTEQVREIIERVRADGDRALLELEARFDGAELTQLEVTEAEVQEASAAVEPEFLAVLRRAAENIRAFHLRQKRQGFRMEREGLVLGQRILPIRRVGVCVPGGAAPLASTVLMNVIPAVIAGCAEIVMVSPAGKSGKLDPHLLAAAAEAGAQRIFKLGGAQGVAAMAYGTESVPKVDKIVGPGGAYVSEAKRQVFGAVDIDMIAGPSEILVVADGASDPVWVAADLLSQAEHDRFAAAILATDSEDLALAVQREIERQLPALPRRDIARASIDSNGRILLCSSIDEALELSDALAPEHLELCLDEPFAWLDRVHHAGSVFLGRHTPEAMGDYLAGVNHTLPTSGTARFSSPLSVDDFVRSSQYLYCPPEAMAAAADDVALFARAERLEGHARSALTRKGETP